MITLIGWIAAYIIGGAIIAYQVNKTHRQRFNENIHGIALKRGIFLLIFWPISMFVMTFPPTRRYVETGSFKR